MIRSHSRLGFKSKSFWITSREEIVHHESSFFGIISVFFVTNHYPSNSVHINMKKEKKNLSNQVKASIYDNFHDICFTETFYKKKKKKKVSFYFYFIKSHLCSQQAPSTLSWFPHEENWSFLFADSWNIEICLYLALISFLVEWGQGQLHGPVTRTIVYGPHSEGSHAWALLSQSWNS